MLGLGGYGSDSGSDSAAAVSDGGGGGASAADAGVAGFGFGLAGYQSDEGNAEAAAEAQAAEERAARMAEHQAALATMREALDFTRFELDVLPPHVDAGGHGDGDGDAKRPSEQAAQEELLAHMVEEGKDPTQFIAGHHDFKNPERTASVLQRIRAEEGIEVRTYCSNIPARATLLRSVAARPRPLGEEVAETLLKIHKEREERKRRAAQQQQQPAAAAAAAAAAAVAGGPGGEESRSSSPSPAPSPPPGVSVLLRRRSSTMK